MQLNPLDLDLVVILATIVATALIGRWTHLPITALEIIAGIGLAAALGFTLPTGTTTVLVYGGLLIVFLAGLETNLSFLRAHLRPALLVGVGGFVVPFAGLFGFLYGIVHAPLLISVIGATALADTSISIVYTTLHQYELVDLPLGRLILAATLAVNLAEDFAITTTTFLATPGFLFTLGVLALLGVAVLTLPRLARWIARYAAGSSFSNVSARTLLLCLAILTLISALVGVPGILFVFLLGLLFSDFAAAEFTANIRQIAFALFVPVYFLAVGLRVDLGFVVGHWALLLGLVAVASVLKVGSIRLTARPVFGKTRASPVAVLMNTRLTSATVILSLMLALGVLPISWYSVFISAVVILALASVLVLRTFSAFQSPEAARALFQTPVAEIAHDEPRSPVPHPTA